MILLLFLLTEAADPLRIFHRIAQPIMSFEDEAKFLLISNHFRKFSKRILVNDDITIFKFEDQLKFPTEIALFPKVQEFLEEKINQKSENVDFAYDEHHDGLGARGIVAMLHRETNELIGRESSGKRFALSQLFPEPSDVFIFHSLHYQLIASDNIFLMMIKNNFPLGMLSSAADDTETLANWALEDSLHKTSLYLTQNQLETNNAMHNRSGSALFYLLISAMREFHESLLAIDYDSLTMYEILAHNALVGRFVKVSRRMLSGFAKFADVHDADLLRDRRLKYLSRYFPETLAILIKRGLDVAQTGNSLHIAAEYGNIDLIEALLTHGVQVDARDEDNFTALMRAARNMNVESLKVLLVHGADTSLQYRAWGTALNVMESAHTGNYQHACHENFDQCRRLLSCPRILVQILVKKSITDKFNVLRDTLVSFCHDIIGV